MPTTRRQAAQSENGGAAVEHQKELRTKSAPRANRASPKKHSKEAGPIVGEKRDSGQQKGVMNEEQQKEEEPPAKKAKTEALEEVKLESNEEAKSQAAEKREKDSSNAQTNEERTSEMLQETSKDHPASHQYQTGTIERGHIYFFYRPKVELEEAHSIDDVQRFHILLIPQPPEFSTSSSDQPAKDIGDKDEEMTLIAEGADAVPAPESTNQEKKPFRLLVVGKKSLPDPEEGRGRNNIFWATIVTVGEDLKKLEEGLGPKQYETKTRGTRHQGPARLAARGAYAIVNKEARIPSQRETHFGYHLSHPTPEHFSEVQEELGIHNASSFVLQVKNPLAPPTGFGRVGLPKNRTVDYPEDIMREVFGKSGARGREDFGLRFASVERKQLLDYEGVELLFIAARSGEDGLEQSLGDGRGTALRDAEEKEGRESIQEVFKELTMDSGKISSDPLEGMWA